MSNISREQEQEQEIGRRERMFDVKRQAFFEAERGLQRLQRLSDLPGGTQLVGFNSIVKAEARLVETREAATQAADELREAWAWRGGEQPVISLATPSTELVFEDSPLLRQMELESAVEKNKQDLIPYAEKLSRSTLCAVEQLSKKRAEPELAEPRTLAEKITSVEIRINRLTAEIAYLEDQLRPWRLEQAASRLGELRAARSPEMQFADEQLSAKKTHIAQLIAQHKSLLAEMRQQNHVVSQMARNRQEAKTPTDSVR